MSLTGVSLNTETWIIELIRFIPLLAVMGYAAFKDYKTGEVPNKIWFYAIIGGLLTALETILFFSVPLFTINLLVALGSIGFGFLLFLLGNGGADTKAIMTLGLSAPLMPFWSFLWPIPLPFLVMLIACILALPVMLAKKSDKPLMKRGIRFLPFLFVGLIVCVIL
jgi:Flp pilus assembly protein protease CpaA